MNTYHSDGQRFSCCHAVVEDVMTVYFLARSAILCVCGRRGVIACLKLNYSVALVSLKTVTTV